MIATLEDTWTDLIQLEYIVLAVEDLDPYKAGHIQFQKTTSFQVGNDGGSCLDRPASGSTLNSALPGSKVSSNQSQPSTSSRGNVAKQCKHKSTISRKQCTNLTSHKTALCGQHRPK
jgi:hypothetical protein